jgi:tetratricopeptide (TPR) repeat protein
VTRALVMHRNAAPSWLRLGDENTAFSAGAARALNLTIATVLALGGAWLIAGGSDDVTQPAVGSPEQAPTAAPPSLPVDGTTKDAKAIDATSPEPPATSDTVTPPASDAKARDPAAAAALVQRGEIALKSGKRSSARKQFEEALTLDPTNPAAMMGLSNLSFDAGNYAAAERHAKQAVELAPRNADYRLRLGDACFKLGQIARARTHYERAAKLGHPSANSRLSRLPK